MNSFFKKTEPLVSFYEVLELLGKEKSWLHEQIRLGKFPKPDRKVGKNNYWSQSLINKYQEEDAKKKIKSTCQKQYQFDDSFVYVSAIPCSITFKY